MGHGKHRSIVLATVLLALFKVIEPDGAIGLLSGIAGYVLGSINQPGKDDPKGPNQSTGSAKHDSLTDKKAGLSTG